MSYLRFDKMQMTNLQDSLYKEFLITSRSGAYCSSTLVGCNIRKYHGLLVVPIPELDDENHVLLSSLDETVVQHGAEFNLALHKYRGDNFAPKGHKYIASFEWEKVPTWTYRIGGVMLKKEISYGVHDSRLYVRYTLLDAHSRTTLRLRPFLAYRSVREWTHENQNIDRSYRECEGGVSMCLYKGYPELFMQLNKAANFAYQPDWYRGMEYAKESERGHYELEDLFTPGYFEFDIKKGESVVFSAALKPEEIKKLNKMMEAEIAPRLPLDSFYHCLMHAAHQFKYEHGGENYLLAGYHWFKPRARDTFIAMPGLTLCIGEPEEYELYMATAEKAIRDLIEGRPISVGIYEMEQPDVLLWAVLCLQMYGKFMGRKKCFEKYGQLLLDIVDYIWNSKHPNLFRHDNGLLYSNGRDKAVTWMNSEAGGRPIVPRSGYIVEFNALWYDTLRFCEQILVEHGGDKYADQAERFRAEAEKVQKSFKDVFLNEHGYLLDYVDGQMIDWSVRPNQLLAIALDFSPLDLKERKRILDICTRELVTPKGVRSLSPKSGGYNPRYVGTQVQRDYAYHQGTAWPWLTGFYLAAYQRVYKTSGLNYIERQLIGFEEELFYHCIGTIPELFDGNPKFSGRGAISFAMNVCGILNSIYLLEQYKKNEE